jgi:Fe-S cluster biogenesis protein NfuA
MFIETEQTPNPATLKFLPGRPVLGEGTAYFESAQAAQASPLALRLFAIDGVTAVFLGDHFVTVSKAGTVEWVLLKAPILGAIMDHFLSGAPVLAEGTDIGDGHATDVDMDPADGEIVEAIKELLDTRVRPSVAQDGGDITFHGFQKGVVFLSMRGSCAGCPSSTATLRYGIENLLKHYVPEVQEVRAVA